MTNISRVAAKRQFAALLMENASPRCLNKDYCISTFQFPRNGSGWRCLASVHTLKYPHSFDPPRGWPHKTKHQRHPTLQKKTTTNLPWGSCAPAGLLHVAVLGVVDIIYVFSDLDHWSLLALSYAHRRE